MRKPAPRFQPGQVVGLDQTMPCGRLTVPAGAAVTVAYVQERFRRPPRTAPDGWSRYWYGITWTHGRHEAKLLVPECILADQPGMMRPVWVFGRVSWDDRGRIFV